MSLASVMAGQHRVPIRHKLYIGDAMLAALGVISLGFSLALLVPYFPVAGPATVVLYDLLPRHAWGMAFGALLFPIGFALFQPTEQSRRVAVAVLTTAALCWMTGLGVPLFKEPPGGGNVLAVLAFAIPTTLGILTTWLVPFDDDTVWRPLSRKG